MGTCNRDDDCASNELGLNRCEVVSGRCVQCLPSADNCPADQYCDPTTFACVRGCRDDSACRMSGSSPRCDPTSRRCVDCVVDGDCGSGSLCVGGVCVAGCAGGRGCGPGESCCSGACVNTTSNVASCGACGNVCRVANGSATCDMGMCLVGACTGTRRDCDRDAANGCETDTQSNINHCGSCGRVCPSPPNAAGNCTAGVCGFTCTDGFADCNGVPEDGCEVNLSASPENCGRCMNRCATAGATAACTNGQCAVGRCGDDQADCDGDPTNGCETNTRTSTAHCGMCGNRCPTPANGTPACTNGACGIGRCNDGFGDCDGMAGNGCETPLRNDPANCGACGTRCAVPNASAVCMNGTCGIGACNPGFADCNNDPADGCEVDTRTSNDHCGMCGARCVVANGAPMCTAGACRIGTCNPGFADCNGRVDDGCETPVNFDPNNCGRCGNSCPIPSSGSRVCRAGTCAIGSCQTGTEDCDMNSANGCEVPILTDLNNCGACGRRCPTPPNAVPELRRRRLRHPALQRGLGRLRRQRHQRLRDQHHPPGQLRPLRQQLRLRQRGRGLHQRHLRPRRLQQRLRQLRRPGLQRLRDLPRRQHLELRRLREYLPRPLGGERLVRERRVPIRVSHGPDRLRRRVPGHRRGLHLRRAPAAAPRAAAWCARGRARPATPCRARAGRAPRPRAACATPAATACAPRGSRSAAAPAATSRPTPPTAAPAAAPAPPTPRASAACASVKAPCASPSPGTSAATWTSM